MNDSKVFKAVIVKIKTRMKELESDLEKHTVVFDRGNNSKKNMAIVKELKLQYVGALTPYHHKELIEDAANGFVEIRIDDKVFQTYRDKRIIWGEERTVIVFISNTLIL